MAFTGMDDAMRKLLSRTDVHKQLGVVIPGTVEFVVPILHDGKLDQIGLVAANDPNNNGGTFTCQIENVTQGTVLVDLAGPADLHGMGAATMLDVALDGANLALTEGDVIKFTVDVSDGGASGGDDLAAVIEYSKAVKA